jgi:hypothetical protein
MATARTEMDIPVRVFALRMYMIFPFSFIVAVMLDGREPGQDARRLGRLIGLEKEAD